MKISMTVCDKCQSKDKPASTYRISADGRTVSVDLCDDDSAPIRELFKASSAKTTTRRTGGSRGPKVVSFSEVEQAKTKTK